MLLVLLPRLCHTLPRIHRDPACTCDGKHMFTLAGRWYSKCQWIRFLRRDCNLRRRHTYSAATGQSGLLLLWTIVWLRPRGRRLADRTQQRPRLLGQLELEWPQFSPALNHVFE